MAYCNNVFLPAIAECKKKTRKYGKGDDAAAEPDPIIRHTVIWYHDKSTFYANDRRKTRWVHKSETAKPYAKDEGHSLMVAHFVSADYGWLESPDGKKNARVLFHAGKGHDGYCDNENIRQQTDSHRSGAHMAATMYRVSRSTEDIQCSVLYRSTGPGRFLLGSLYVVYIYTLDIHCIVLDGSTGPTRGHRCRLYESGTRMRAPSGTRLGAYFRVL